MPMMKCTKDGKPGIKWGEHGTCYTYTSGDTKSKARAAQKADNQRRAIEANKP